jgi:hypothetical protein
VLFGSADKVTGICSKENTQKWILQNDNAPVHDALRVHEFLAKKSITKMDHPPCSPHLAPCDFWLFPKLKIALKGQRLVDIPDIQRDMILL